MLDLALEGLSALDQADHYKLEPLIFASIELLGTIDQLEALLAHSRVRLAPPPPPARAPRPRRAPPLPAPPAELRDPDRQ
jgi:hypothetical protein